MWKALSVLALLMVLLFVSGNFYLVPTQEVLIGRAANMTVRVDVDGGCGTGVILDSHHILTAAHVVAGADSLLIRLTNGIEFKATAIRSNTEMDLALLWTDYTIQEAPVIIAELTPFRYTKTWSVGYANCINRLVATEGLYQGDLIGDGTYRSLTTSLGVPGNSGGGLFVFDGGKVYLVGIVVALRANQWGPITHLVYAVTLQDVKDFLSPLDRSVK